ERPPTKSLGRPVGARTLLDSRNLKRRRSEGSRRMISDCFPFGSRHLTDSPESKACSISALVRRAIHTSTPTNKVSVIAIRVLLGALPIAGAIEDAEPARGASPSIVI